MHDGLIGHIGCIHVVMRWSRGLIVAALIAGCSILGGCGGKKEGVIGEDPLSNVFKAENNVRTLSHWARKKARADVLIRFDTSDDMVEFVQQHIASMNDVARELNRGEADKLAQVSRLVENNGVVNLGYMAGMYKRVIWVVPFTQSTGLDTTETFKRYLIERRGYTMEDLRDLHLEGKHITGTLTGVPITISILGDIDITDETALVDIDLAYFRALKSQVPGYQAGTRALLDFLTALKEKGILARSVAVTLSTVKGIVPLDIRYYGDVIIEALGDPAPLGGDPKDKWKLMMEAEDSLIAANYAYAGNLYDQLTEKNSSEAGLFFSLAVTRGFQEDAESCGEALLRAYQLDGAYLRGIFQLATVLAVSGRLETGEKLLDLPILNNIVSPYEMHYQKGLFYLSAGRPRSAARHLQRVTNQRPNDFALYTVIYRAHREANNTSGMASTLHKLISLDVERVERDMPWVYLELGKLAEDSRLLLAAARHYEAYLRLVPDAPEAEDLKTKIEIFRNP